VCSQPIHFFTNILCLSPSTNFCQWCVMCKSEIVVKPETWIKYKLTENIEFLMITCCRSSVHSSLTYQLNIRRAYPYYSCSNTWLACLFIRSYFVACRVVPSDGGFYIFHSATFWSKQAPSIIHVPKYMRSISLHYARFFALSVWNITKCQEIITKKEEFNGHQWHLHGKKL